MATPPRIIALGVMSIKGQGVKQNPQQGLKWLMAAARKRYAPAEAYLGELYWEGSSCGRTGPAPSCGTFSPGNPPGRKKTRRSTIAPCSSRPTSVEDERIEAEARARSLGWPVSGRRRQPQRLRPTER